MSVEKTGVLVSRGVGVGLIVMGLSSVPYLPFFQPAGLPTSGWTSYSPLESATNIVQSISNSYFVTETIMISYLPPSIQAGAGFLMILFSKPVGRWLSRGLAESDREA
jgi:hypothetical protein